MICSISFSLSPLLSSYLLLYCPCMGASSMTDSQTFPLPTHVCKACCFVHGTVQTGMLPCLAFSSINLPTVVARLAALLTLCCSLLCSVSVLVFSSTFGILFNQTLPSCIQEQHFLPHAPTAFPYLHVKNNTFLLPAPPPFPTPL